MLRITSSKLAQRTPGDLSIPGTNQEVMRLPNVPVRIVQDIWKKRQQEKRRNQQTRNFARYESSRDPAHGRCPNCGNFKAIDERGNRFCPSPECNIPRPRFSTPNR